MSGGLTSNGQMGINRSGLAEIIVSYIPIHSHINLLNHSVIFIHSYSYLLNHSFIQSFIYSLIHSFIFINSIIHTYSFIHSLLALLIICFIYELCNNNIFKLCFYGIILTYHFFVALALYSFLVNI